MSLHQTVVTLRRAEGVQFVLGYSGKWHSRLNDCSVEGISFPDDATPGSFDLFQRLRECARVQLGLYVWAAYNPTNTLKLVEIFVNQLTVELFSLKDTEKLATKTDIRLFIKKQNGKPSGPCIWNDKVKRVIT